MRVLTEASWASNKYTAAHEQVTTQERKADWDASQVLPDLLCWLDFQLSTLATQKPSMIERRLKTRPSSTFPGEAFFIQQNGSECLLCARHYSMH